MEINNAAEIPHLAHWIRWRMQIRKMKSGITDEQTQRKAANAQANYMMLSALYWGKR